MSVYPNVATGDLTTSVIGSLYNRVKDASMLAAKSKKEAFNRFKKTGLSDKQAQDAVDHYNFGGAAFKSRFGGDRLRRTRGFFGSRRPQDDIAVSEQERVLRGMGLFARRKRGSSGRVDPETGEPTGTDSGAGAESAENQNPESSFISMQALLPPAGNNLDEAIKGVGRDGEYLTKEQRVDIFKKNRVARDADSIFSKSSESPSTPAPQPASIQKVGTGDLIGSAIEKAFEDKNKELVEVIKDTADRVEDNQEILEKIERNTSFIEKLFELQKDAIEDAKIAAEEAEIDETKDTAGFAGYKKLGGMFGGGGGGGILGNLLDFGGNLLDLAGGRRIGRPGARRRLARQKSKRFLGRQKNRLFGGRKQTLRTPVGTRNEGKFVNNRLYKTKVSQFAPKKKNFLQKGLQKTNIAGKKIGKKLFSGAAKKAGTKAITKGVGKGVGKALLKKIPILGLGVGALFAAQRAMAGDFVGAGLELASGAASTVPGFGTAASVGIDAALMAKDINDASQMEQPEFEMGGVSDGPIVATLHGKEAVIPVKKDGFDNNPINKFFNNSEKTEKNIFSYLNSVSDNNDKVSAEMGAIVDGPDTGYKVALPNERQAIVPLDNKFTRGEPTVTQGGEYERGNVNLEVEQPEEKKQTLAEKKKIQKDLSEAFRMGLDLYQKKTPGGFLGELGNKIMDFLNKFGGGGNPDNDGGGGDAPDVDVSGGPDMTAADLDGFSEKEVSDLGRIVSAEAGTDEKGGAHVLNSILNRHRQIKQGKATPESWGITGKTKDEVTITDIINATNQFQPMRDGSFAKTTETQGRQALAAAIKGGGLDPRMVKQKLIDGGMSEEDATIVAVADSFYNPNLSDNKPFPTATAVKTDNKHSFMSSPNTGFKPGDLKDLDAVTGDAPEEVTSGDTQHHPNQQITDAYGLKVGEEREFTTSRGTKVKAHKTTKGFDFYNPGINQIIDFSNGRNGWVVDDFIKSEGGLKPELLKPEPSPEPPAPANTGAAKAEEVKVSSAAAREATTAKTIAMAVPAAAAPVAAPTPTTPAAGSTELSSKPSDTALNGLSYLSNLNQLGATA